ncbi:uncharacterized protein BDZ99DRAFT_517728 [Mytilinidion resinicola]|uniref:Uncharacterized protein n=1 Tax=Mytilinidion resinicola TaxID=574789 RepID=A0A6A6YX14_9PEZI|nr:uncharacterized protein BDZ99DRAFT_517728 [Mytilinidion resinicola]KAF2813472.1 hypothetical protein BDZ99DRAFT_517728 [Mytilinidion resinicola]
MALILSALSSTAVSWNHNRVHRNEHGIRGITVRCYFRRDAGPHEQQKKESISQVSRRLYQKLQLQLHLGLPVTPSTLFPAKRHVARLWLHTIFQKMAAAVTSASYHHVWRPLREREPAPGTQQPTAGPRSTGGVFISPRGHRTIPAGPTTRLVGHGQ